MRQRAQIETQCVPSEHQETLFNCGGDQEKGQIAQKTVENIYCKYLRAWI